MKIKCSLCRTIILADVKRIRDHYAREHSLGISVDEAKKIIADGESNPPNINKIAGKTKKKKRRIHKSPTGKLPDYDVGKGRGDGPHKGVFQGGAPGLGKGKS